MKKRELLRLHAKLRDTEIESANTEDELYGRYRAAKFEYDNYRAKSKRKIGALQSEIVSKEYEVNDLGEMDISVRIGDLLDQLSRLSGISREDIVIKLETSVVMQDFLKTVKMPLNGLDYHKLIITIDGRDSKRDRDFKYMTSIPLDVDLLSKKDGSLGEHCSLRYDVEYGDRYTRVILDKDVDDIVLNFNLKQLDVRDSASWYPANLFAGAIICAIREKKDRDKKRVRTNGLFKKRG